MNNEQKQKARLENWHLRSNGFDGETRLHGQVYGHPRFKDGDAVITSKLINKDWKNNLVETLNTIYTLGKQYDESKTTG